MIKSKAFDVSELLKEIESNPGLWNRHRSRLVGYGPHSALSDIWVRYNDISNVGRDFNGPHKSVWYPAAYEIPSVFPLIAGTLDLVHGKELGGVLITKIPPGEECKPHRDSGWHAEYYNLKVAVQLKGNKDQAFHFETESLSALPGDVYVFQNQYTHWVTNPTDEERMTLIIAIKD